MAYGGRPMAGRTPRFRHVGIHERVRAGRDGSDHGRLGVAQTDGAMFHIYYSEIKCMLCKIFSYGRMCIGNPSTKK